MPTATRPAVPVRKFSNNPLIAFYQSSIGKKLIVAVTALVLILYVLGRLLGNLQIYIGQDRINTYAKFLHDLGSMRMPVIWPNSRPILASAFLHSSLLRGSFIGVLWMLSGNVVFQMTFTNVSSSC